MKSKRHTYLGPFSMAGLALHFGDACIIKDIYPPGYEPGYKFDDAFTKFWARDDMPIPEGAKPCQD